MICNIKIKKHSNLRENRGKDNNLFLINNRKSVKMFGLLKFLTYLVLAIVKYNAWCR